MIVISSALALMPVTSDPPLSYPVLGWNNIVTASNLNANKEDPDHPVSELANPSTYLFWRGADTSEQYLTVETGGVDPIDYVAFVRHNFGSAAAAIAVTIEGQTEDGGSWSTLVEEVILPGDGPAMFRFPPTSLFAIRAKLGTGRALAEAGVMYVGKLTAFPRGVEGPFTPLTYGLRNDIVTGRSEAGNYLGRIQSGGKRESIVGFEFLPASWFRTYLSPFLASGVDLPFFFAWAPQAFPAEVGFAWLTESPRPSFDMAGYVGVELPMTGVIQ